VNCLSLTTEHYSWQNVIRKQLIDWNLEAQVGMVLPGSDY